MMSRFSLVVANGKGGVGKTSLTANLAAQWAEQCRVLVVDLDVQRNLASVLGLGVIDRSPVLDGIVETGRTNLLYAAWTVPSNPVEAVTVLTEGVATVDVDVVVVDTPPASNSVEAQAALRACEWLLVPMRCDSHSMDGLVTLLQQANEIVVADRYRLAVPLAICLFTVNPRATRYLNAIRHELADLLGASNLKVLTRMVRTAERAQTAALNKGLTAAEYAGVNKHPSNARLLAEDYMAIANEVTQLIATRQKG